jgi:ubiquinone/menaquinone biosynthesis C-methylase UbiE
MTREKQIKETVKEHYTALAHGGSSCRSSVCCDDSGNHLVQLGYKPEELANLPEEAVSVGAGCGSPVSLAELQPGEVVVDLGSGGGIDVLLAAQKVGLSGRVIGVDMTPAMIEKAKENARKARLENVDFRIGEIEDLPLESNSVDVVISNCVINLSPDKDRVFREAFRVLRPDGRLVVSDIVTKGKLPQAIRKNLEAWAGCVAGALEDHDYLEKLATAGFKAIETLSEQPSALGSIYSLTVRACKPRTA